MTFMADILSDNGLYVVPRFGVAWQHTNNSSAFGSAGNFRSGKCWLCCLHFVRRSFVCLI